MTGQVSHGRSQRAARRAWIVIGVVLLCALGVWISVHFIVPERSKDIWVESAKSALQLAVLATTGGVVAAVLRDRDAAREADGRRRTLLLGFLDSVQETYGQVKAARRILRTLGFDAPTNGALSVEQASGFRTQMAMLSELELTFEVEGRRAVRMSGELGPAAADIQRELDGVAAYLRQVLLEWERDSTVITAGATGAAVAGWPLFGAFVRYDDASKREFEERVSEPIGRVEAIILDALGLAAPSGSA
jgi:hypothetical protein